MGLNQLNITNFGPKNQKICDIFTTGSDIIINMSMTSGLVKFEIDGSTINPEFYSLLKKFGTITGTPVLLNTSFNIQGQPIIESPEDAIRCLYSTGLDALALGSYLINKNSA